MIHPNESMKEPRPTIEIDGETIPFDPGESVFEIANRRGREVPSLCYDPRLEAFGSCRLCVVEIDGRRGPVASCTTEAEAGMVVRTKTDELESTRRTLVEMVASEVPETAVDPLHGHASQELGDLAKRYDARPGRFEGAISGLPLPEDDNPFIERNMAQCISCHRCVRVCAEQEGDFAIAALGRGFGTHIGTEFEGKLEDSSCTFCGQCVQTCPTGALGDRKALRAVAIEAPIERTRTVCAYCGVGCTVEILSKEDRIVGIQPGMDGPANEGALCVKGQFAFDFIRHPDRLDRPLVRNTAGELEPTDWDTALNRAAKGFAEAAKQYGEESVYAIASGRAPHEAAYTIQKWVRSGFGTNQIDNCSRA